MRAAVCKEYGEPETVTVEELPSPCPTPGRWWCGSAAAAVNFPDVLLVADRYQVSVPGPFTPGSEFAGEVVTVETGSPSSGSASRSSVP